MAFTRQTPAPRRRFTATAALAISVLVPTLTFPAHARPVEGLPYLTDVEIVGRTACDTCPPQVCAERPVLVRVKGQVGGCVSYHGLQVLPRRGFPTPLVIATFVVDTCGPACPDFIRAFTDSVTIPSLPIGSQQLWVESHVRTCPDTSQIARTGARPFPVEVLADCDRPPVDSLLRSFLAFRVEPFVRCPGDSLRLEMMKAGCPPCLRFESLFSDIQGGIHATMNWRPGCLEFACISESLSVPIGAFMAGHYQMLVGVQAHILGTSVADSTVTFQVDVPFDVGPTCDSSTCVTPVLFAANGGVDCALDLAPGGEGALTLYARTGKPLGGLQGELFCPPPFRVTGVFPPDLPGYHVTWVPEGERGARYILFTTGGATVPARVSEVLKVGIAADSDATIGLRTSMNAPVRLASDPNGVAVPICDIRNIRFAGVPLCVGGTAGACDVNHDGYADVRDLVLQAKCALIVPPPGGTDRCPDCDGDGGWAFQDLLCCAQRILRLPIPPRDSVNGDGPQVTIEETARDEVGIDVRVRITGADPLGAAMLRLRYPGDRWRGFDGRVFPLATTDAPGWYPIVDTELPGVLQLGGLRLSSIASPEIEFRLRFILEGDPKATDQLVVEGADLAGSDGTAFTLPSLPRFTLEPPVPVIPRVELGAPRPNPFSRSTSFSVSLPQPAHVELVIHDLFGRRVATLLSHDLPAGRRDATWDAGSARDGLYFARLVVNGKVYTQRVALLRDRR